MQVSDWVRVRDKQRAPATWGMERIMPADLLHPWQLLQHIVNDGDLRQVARKRV